MKKLYKSEFLFCKKYGLKKYKWDWPTIGMMPSLDEAFISRNIKYLEKDYINFRRYFSEQFMNKHPSKIDWEYASSCVKIY